MVAEHKIQKNTDKKNIAKLSAKYILFKITGIIADKNDTTNTLKKTSFTNLLAGKLIIFRNKIKRASKQEKDKKTATYKIHSGG